MRANSSFRTSPVDFQVSTPQIAFLAVSKNSLTIGKFFRFKDELPPCMRSSVIYKFTCGDCDAYLGCTQLRFSPSATDGTLKYRVLISIMEVKPVQLGLCLLTSLIVDYCFLRSWTAITT